MPFEEIWPPSIGEIISKPFPEMIYAISLLSLQIVLRDPTAPNGTPIPDCASEFGHP